MHTTRRTCASLLVALDVHPRVTMQILRHSQIAVTMNGYSEATAEATRTALKRLGDQFGSWPGFTRGPAGTRVRRGGHPPEGREAT